MLNLLTLVPCCTLDQAASRLVAMPVVVPYQPYKLETCNPDFSSMAHPNCGYELVRISAIS